MGCPATEEERMSETETQDAGPPAPILDEHAVQEVAPGVHVISDRRIPLVPNVGIVLGDGEALVVDPGMGPRNGARVLAATRRLAPEDRLTLTTTHFHPEHAFGAQVFAGEARYVANRAQVEELRAKGQAYIDLFKTFGPSVAAELEGVELVEAEETYDGSLDLEVGGVPVQLREWGLAHTGGDQVVFLPEQRVLFTGDLVENRFFSIFPFFPPDDVDVDGSRWIEVLRRLEELGAAVVVPGHGEVGGPELIPEVRAYLEHVRDATQGALDEGRSADEAVAALEEGIRARWATWDAPEWIGFAIRSFHATLGR
jgi:glyoxylase-like metal-dependent hydrolase (beta-lactamase superfamily II)